MTTWISIGKVAKLYGVTTQTIRNWTKQGKLQAKRTMGSHRRYEKVEPQTNECENGLTVTYARVSSNDQKEDLARQSQELKKYCQDRQIGNVTSIEEIGSGINYQKRDLRKLIDGILAGRVKRVVVSYTDRLLRFGTELIEQVCQAKGVEIVAINSRQPKSFSEELVEDVLTIMTVFCSKIYGKRSHERKKSRQDTQCRS